MKNILNSITRSSTIIVLLLFGMLAEVQAQKCKFDFDKEDPISGDRVRRNNYKLKKQAFTVSYYRKKDEFKLELSMIFAGARTFSVTTSDQLVLKLSNNETITVYPSKEFAPTSQATGSGVYTFYAISYNATQEQYQQISENGVVHVRSNMGGETYDVEVKEKMAEKMKIGAGCMVKG